MQKKLLLLTFFISFLGLSFKTFANCAHPLTVIYKCHEWNGHKICTWGPLGGWYEGSSDYSSSLHDGDHLGADAFKKAIWYPYRDASHGATTCLYVGPEGEKVTLFQQTAYGEVPPPSGSLWKPSDEVGFPDSLECTANTATCKFEFGERT